MILMRLMFLRQQGISQVTKKLQAMVVQFVSMDRMF
uniref:Uncharacterized protein n=1 Tax=Rhizophora mucronata TaxID=61149 RepID=A0A2P2P2A9_RHIMU